MGAPIPQISQNFFGANSVCFMLGSTLRSRWSPIPPGASSLLNIGGRWNALGQLCFYWSTPSSFHKAKSAKDVAKQVRLHQKRFSDGERGKKNLLFKHNKSMMDRRESHYTKTSIQAAVADKNIPYLEECLENHKGLHARDENLMTVAATYRGRALLSDLLRKGFNPNEANRLGITPLHYATLTNDRDSCLLLLQHGADPTAADERGLQAIHKAAYANSHRCLALLLHSGLNPDSRDADEETPLHFAAQQGSYRSCQILLKKGATVDARHAEGGTPLHHAAYSGYHRIVRLLLDAGACPRARDGQGLLPLHRTCQRKDTKNCVQILAKEAPNTLDDMENETGMAPIHFAAYSGNIDAVECLATGGASTIDTPGPSGWTPFLLAGQAGDIGCMSLLTQYGANPRATTDTGMGAMHIAPAAHVVAFLVNQGLDVNAKDDFSITPLHSAAHRGDTGVVAALLEHNAQVNEVAEGLTPLHLAATADSPDLVEALLESGADINAQSPTGETPLHMAIQSEGMVSAGVLLEHNARIDLQNEEGSTPFDLLADPEMIRLLHKARANRPTSQADD